MSVDSNVPTPSSPVNGDKPKPNRRSARRKTPLTASTAASTTTTATGTSTPTETNSTTTPCDPEPLVSRSTTSIDSPAPTCNDGSDGPNTITTGIIHELHRGIRNVNKKLNLMQKLDAIIAQHPSLSLDELVAQRKINADQKAQALKKPALQASLSQMEEQLVMLAKIEADHSAQLATERDRLDRLESTHRDEIDRLKSDFENAKSEIEADVAARVRDEVEAEWVSKARAQARAAADAAVAAAEADNRGAADWEIKATSGRNLLTFSRFLRVAASVRQHNDPNDPTTLAFEGLLLQSYGGDRAAVDAVEKLIEGSDEKIKSVEGRVLDVTFADVKRATLAEFADVDGNHENHGEPFVPTESIKADLSNGTEGKSKPDAEPASPVDSFDPTSQESSDTSPPPGVSIHNVDSGAATPNGPNQHAGPDSPNHDSRRGRWGFRGGRGGDGRGRGRGWGRGGGRGGRGARAGGAGGIGFRGDHNRSTVPV